MGALGGGGAFRCLHHRPIRVLLHLILLLETVFCCRIKRVFAGLGFLLNYGWRSVLSLQGWYETKIHNFYHIGEQECVRGEEQDINLWVGRYEIYLDRVLIEVINLYCERRQLTVAYFSNL